MKITKQTIIKAIRTFFQAFLGSFITLGAGIEWYNVSIKHAIVCTIITSLFAGLSAIVMNLEKEE